MYQSIRRDLLLHNSDSAYIGIRMSGMALDAHQKTNICVRVTTDPGYAYHRLWHRIRRSPRTRWHQNVARQTRESHQKVLPVHMSSRHCLDDIWTGRTFCTTFCQLHGTMKLFWDWELVKIIQFLTVKLKDSNVFLTIFVEQIPMILS